VLFCGINPGLYSGATGCHFARPGNRFWPALATAGFTATQLAPSQSRQLLAHGIGITNLVARARWRSWASVPTARRSIVPTRGLDASLRRCTAPCCGCCRTRAVSTRTTSPAISRGCSQRRVERLTGSEGPSGGLRDLPQAERRVGPRYRQRAERAAHRIGTLGHSVRRIARWVTRLFHRRHAGHEAERAQPRARLECAPQIGGRARYSSRASEP
jgi:hypothetical protein